MDRHFVVISSEDGEHVYAEWWPERYEAIDQMGEADRALEAWSEEYARVLDEVPTSEARSVLLKKIVEDATRDVGFDWEPWTVYHVSVFVMPHCIPYPMFSGPRKDES